MAVDLLASVVVALLLVRLTLFDPSTEGTPPAAAAIACGWFVLLCAEVDCGRPLVWQVSAAAGVKDAGRMVAERRTRLRYWCRAKLALFAPWFVVIGCGYLTEREWARGQWRFLADKALPPLELVFGIVAAVAGLILFAAAVGSGPEGTPDAGRCRRCGYDLRATPGRCPECEATSGPPSV